MSSIETALKVADLSAAQLQASLRRGEFVLDLQPFTARITSDIPALGRDIALMYADFPVLAPGGFVDFHVEVSRESGLRRWFKPQGRFYFDGQPSFIPLPAGQAFAMLEWGLNWCVAAHCHQYLVIHAAVIEKNGKAAVLPAPPGSGKSTLCAALVLRGWRLLSDELALYDLETGLIHGMARAVNLKNASIDVIRRHAPEAVLTAPVPDTTKGTVALLRPPAESVRRVAEPVRADWIILPRYVPDAPPLLQPHGRARTFMLIAEQSFNYDLQGRRGFDAVGALVDRARCYRFTYSRLDDAERVFDDLAAGRLE